MPNFDELSNRISPDAQVITDLTDFDDYRHDASVGSGDPSAIVFVRNESDIIETINFCRKNNLSLVGRGAGTGLSGGCIPDDGAVVLTLEKMTSLTIDSFKKIAYAEPGVITKTISDITAHHKLFYPPDPASFDESTIGGNVAENAGGLKCVKYGVTKDYVLGIKAVTSSGEFVKTGVYNDFEGFGFTELFTGSEGTLAIITEIALRLIDIRPAGHTILTVFDNPKNAAQTVSDIRMNGITPIVMEFLDGDAAACSNTYEKHEFIDDSAAAILLIESETEDSGEIEKICRKNRCTYIQREVEPDKVEQLWKVRRNLSKAIKAMATTRISEDIVVPISKFPDLVAFVSEMNNSSPLRINSFGHAGDGNLHVYFLGNEGTDAEQKEIEKQIERLLRKTIELGGTLTGEHGIGLAKRDYLHFEFDSPTLGFMKKFREVFDENQLFNPGKIFVK